MCMANPSAIGIALCRDELQMRGMLPPQSRVVVAFVAAVSTISTSCVLPSHLAYPFGAMHGDVRRSGQRDHAGHLYVFESSAGTCV